MKITISKAGVNFEIEGEEILKALFSEENKALWELKRALDKLAPDSEIKEVDVEEPETKISDDEFQALLEFFPSENVIQSVIETFPSSDTEVPFPQEKCLKSIENKPKRKYNVKHKHKVITKKEHICLKCHKEFNPISNSQKYCSVECRLASKAKVIPEPIFEIEPPIPPARRPESTGIFLA